VTLAACGVQAKPQLPQPPAAPPVVEEAAPAQIPPAVQDPVEGLIAASERHFTDGQREFQRGHLDQAKIAFDLAVDVLLESPEGARTDARLRAHFDRLIDRINALELEAIAQGDGFTEKHYEPATIDDLFEITTFPLPDAGAGTRVSVENDLLVTAHDIPIAPSPKVLQYVELFQGRLRDWFQEALQRGTQYLPMIQSVFRAEGLPLDLAYVPLVESAFKPNALSRAKAKGVWQFMRGTAVENGLRHDWYVDERADPEKATLAAAKYLRSLNQMFEGDWYLALASYNSGPGRVQRAIKRAKSEDYWALSKGTKFLPRETREYVPMILAAIIIAKNPAQYGFQVVTDLASGAFEVVTLPFPMDLRRVAEWTGTSVDVIQTLNPELRRWTTPLKDPAYPVKVPAGTAAQLTERLASASPTDLVSVSEYVIRKGDTLSTIARRLKVATVDLADANGLTRKNKLRPGERLIVPRAPATALAAKTDRPAPAAVAASSGGSDSPVVYRVRRGDTLWSIAQEFDTTVDAIKSWNKLRSSRINVGDRLTIHTNRSDR
jgi:membrane-bound lytic murein transglycosylase D